MGKAVVAMATVSRSTRARRRGDQGPDGGIPALETGDRLSLAEFERRYDAMPRLKMAELIEGVVYVPSPVRIRRHGRPHAHLIHWLVSYESATQGVIAALNPSVRLDLDNEPQPDAVLFIDPARGGQAKVSADDYLEEAPELVAEVSSSTVSFDLNTKLNVYRRNGVREYIVWRVRDGAIDWFALKSRRFVPLPLDKTGLYRSKDFPGLWLDPSALVRGDPRALQAALQRGLASPEHASFVARLNAKAKP
jgi:Uma2 family endonuclease